MTGQPAEPVQQPPKEEPVQQPARDDPDPPAGIIDTLTAADDDAGQLLLTWETPAAPNATPTDYHVNWGKSTEDYPADTAEAGNAHPTDTTLTLTVLEFDTDYNVRVRARYSDGENAASPWNGPWTETTARVKLPLPMAINMTGAAVSPASQVFLFWSDPSNDSITGYQILRGPKADSLVVIEDDTGSTSTSYTDTEPPAGETHTYAVKARNASGLSPLSNTLTATVPTVEEEEVLIVARHEDGERALVSNLGQIQTNSGSFTGTQLGERYEIAIAFTTGANPHGHHITSVQLRTRRSPFNTGTPNPQVSIRADNAGVPSETVLFTFTTSSPITDSFATTTFTTEDATTLQPNTTYWLYATTEGDNALGIRNTASNDEDAVSNTDWKIADKRLGKTDGGTWTESKGDIFQMAIHGHAAPAFLVSNLDSPSTLALFSRRTDADRSKFAQAFSAANNENGTPAEFDFDGVTIQLESAFSTASQLADSDIVVTVHKDSGGQPGDLVYTLTSPETYTVPVPSAPVTFSAPPGSILSSGITYWVKFEIADASTFFTGLTRIDFEFATDNNQVQGPTTYNRWTIGHDSLWSPQTLSWATDVNSIKISVLGAPHYDTLVSNIDQTFLGAEPTGEGGKAAQSFLTPPGPLGQQYRLHRVDINAASQYPTQATIDLHADNNGIPGDHLVSMSMPGDFAPGEFNHVHLTAIAPIGTLLNPGTRYWIVITNDQTSNLLRVGITASKAQDPASLDFWTIDDFRARKEATEYWGTIRDNIQMELLGTPFIRTNEADGPDLPGAGHNAHQTGAVVIPGIVSTGHLTPGLDRNHGLYGDYWWLDTQWGHSYRIEVKFGDSPNTATGGSAWTYFIDGDRRGTCCDSDHNRNDGYTVLHIKHDQNRKYLIDVVVFDKLNSGSKNFNGPYTITMTDITGTDKLVSNLYIGTLTKVANYVGSNRQYASSFTAGHNPRGYKLDRIRTHIPDDHSSPVLALHTDTSFAPGAKLCDFRNPTQVQHLVYWEDFPAPIPFTAPDCADVTLAANGKYWIVFAGTGYKPVVTDSGGELTKEGGWSIGNTALTKTTSTWGDLAGSIIAAEIWASPR